MKFSTSNTPLARMINSNPAATPLHAERLDASTYAGMGDAFADLAARAAQGNPHQSPAALSALCSALIEPADAMVLAVTDPQDVGRLLGVWVMRLSKPRWSLGLPVLKAPAYPVFEPLSLPVIDANHLPDVLTAMLALLMRDPLLPKLVHCPSWPMEGPVAEALTQAIAEARGQLTAFDLWQRSCLSMPEGAAPAGWLTTTFGKRFKRIDAKMKALAGLGQISIHMHRGADCILATRRFLELEARGWKGKAGSALANDARDAAFVLRLAGELATRDEMIIAELALDGAAIASALLPMSGGTVSFFKTTYDEAYRAHSPGVVLDAAITRHLAAMPGFRLMDSGMDDTAPPESTIWQGRRAMGHVLIALGPAPAAWLAA
ncbi:MAG: GNAT family N-acetyltransferase, partial [Bosea sp. (in: a-proteobacteria)]